MTIGDPRALWIPSPSFTRGYPGFGKPLWIIIHGTASGTSYTAQDTGRDFQHSGNSTHYIVGYDGTIVQCVDEANAAWGNGIITGPPGVAPVGGGSRNAPHDSYWDTSGKRDPNMCTISIEHSKSGDNQSQLSNVQLQASFTLIAGIVARWGIPRQYGNAQGGITGHYSMDPVERAFCPGPYPWQQLINYLGGSGLAVSGVSGNAGPIIVDSTLVKTSYIPLSEQVHETLVNTPGFYGMALAIDEAEQFPGYVDLTQPVTIQTPVGSTAVPDVVGTIRSIGATLDDNFIPFVIRSGLVLLGFLLILTLLIKLVPTDMLSEVLKFA